MLKPIGSESYRIFWVHVMLLTFLLRERLRQEAASPDHRASAWLTQMIVNALQQVPASESLWTIFSTRPEPELHSLSLLLITQMVVGGDWTRPFQSSEIDKLVHAAVAPSTATVALWLLQTLIQDPHYHVDDQIEAQLYSIYRVANATHDAATRGQATLAIRTLIPAQSLLDMLAFPHGQKSDVAIDLLATQPNLESLKINEYAILLLSAQLHGEQRDAALTILTRMGFAQEKARDSIIHSLLGELSAARALNDTATVSQMEFGLHYFLALPDATKVMLSLLQSQSVANDLQREVIAWLASDSHADLSHQVIKGDAVEYLLKMLENPQTRPDAAKILAAIVPSQINDKPSYEETPEQITKRESEHSLWEGRIAEALKQAQDAEDHERAVSEKMGVLLRSTLDQNDLQKAIQDVGEKDLRKRLQSRLDTVTYPQLLIQAMESEGDENTRTDFLKKLGQYALFYGGWLKISSKGYVGVLQGLLNAETRTASVVILATAFPPYTALEEKALETLLILRSRGGVHIDPTILTQYIDQKITEIGGDPTEALKKLLQDGAASTLVQAQILRRLAGAVDLGALRQSAPDNYSGLAMLFSHAGLSDQEATAISGSIQNGNDRLDFETERNDSRIGGVTRQYVAGDLMGYLLEKVGIGKDRLWSFYRNDDFSAEARAEALRLLADLKEDESEAILSDPLLARRLAVDLGVTALQTPAAGIVSRLKDPSALDLVREQMLIFHSDWFNNPQYLPFVADVLEQTQNGDVIRAAIDILQRPGQAEAAKLGIQGMQRLLEVLRPPSLRENALSILSRAGGVTLEGFHVLVEALLAEKLSADARKDTEFARRLTQTLIAIRNRVDGRQALQQIAASVLDHPVRMLALSLLGPQTLGRLPASRRKLFARLASIFVFACTLVLNSSHLLRAQSLPPRDIEKILTDATRGQRELTREEKSSISKRFKDPGVEDFIYDTLRTKPDQAFSIQEILPEHYNASRIKELVARKEDPAMQMPNIFPRLAARAILSQWGTAHPNEAPTLIQASGLIPSPEHTLPPTRGARKKVAFLIIESGNTEHDALVKRVIEARLRPGSKARILFSGLQIQDKVDQNPDTIFIVVAALGDNFQDPLRIGGFWPVSWVKEMGYKGVVIVAASGNKGVFAPWAHPSMDNVLYTAAADRSGNKKAWYSNFGPPGYLYMTAAEPTLPGVDPKKLEGTSFSAPQIAAELDNRLEADTNLPEPTAIARLGAEAKSMTGEPLFRSGLLGKGLLPAAGGWISRWPFFVVGLILLSSVVNIIRRKWRQVLRQSSVRFASILQWAAPANKRVVKNLFVASAVLSTPIFLQRFQLPGQDLVYFYFQSTVMLGIFLAGYAWMRRKQLDLTQAKQVLATARKAFLVLMALWPAYAVFHELIHAVFAKIWVPDAYVVIPGWQQMIILSMVAYAIAALLFPNVRQKGLAVLGWAALGITSLGYLSYQPLSDPSPLQFVFGQHTFIHSLQALMIQSNPLGSLIHLFRWPAAPRGLHAMNTFWGPTYTDTPYMYTPWAQLVFLAPHVIQAFLSIVLFRLGNRKSLFLQMTAFGLAAYPTFGGTPIDYLFTSVTKHSNLPEFYVMGLAWWVALQGSNFIRWLMTRGRKTTESAAVSDPIALPNAYLLGLPLIAVALSELLLHVTTFSPGPLGLLAGANLFRWMSDVLRIPYPWIILGISAYAAVRLTSRILTRRLLRRASLLFISGITLLSVQSTNQQVGSHVIGASA